MVASEYGAKLLLSIFMIKEFVIS